MSNCIKCDNKTEVDDSRMRSDGIMRRRRRCLTCGALFTTLEIPLRDERTREQVDWILGG